MPTPKRWFPVSRELNDDPEVWALTDEFGDRSLRIWLEILSILDRSDNSWRVSGGWLASLSRKVRQQPATVQRAVAWMLARGWLEVIETRADGSPAVLGSPNFWKYHRTRELIGTKLPPLRPPPIRPTDQPIRLERSEFATQNGGDEKDRTRKEEKDSILGDLTVRSGDGELTPVSIKEQILKLGEETMNICEEKD